MLFCIASDHHCSKIPPCKVLVIGAGVAGLSAIVTVSEAQTLENSGTGMLTVFVGSSHGCCRARFRHAFGRS